MFSGIVETSGKIESVSTEGSNRNFRITARFSEALKVDQSIAHDGACLTVTRILSSDPDGNHEYTVTAIEETLQKTNLDSWIAGGIINLELCVKAGQRIDGHFVQGHVDTKGIIRSIEDKNGSWMIEIGFPVQFNPLLVQKGSVCVNGVSLTVVNAGDGEFSVGIIPYTWEHTNFKFLKKGDPVNLEFDILGKYILRSMGK